MIDQLFENSLRIAVQLRNSPEGASWRDAWQELGDVQRNIPVVDPLRAPKYDIAELRHHPRFGMHPVLFTHFMSLYSGLSFPGMQEQLQQTPAVQSHLERLHNCYSVISAIISLLRRTSKGFPHNHLVYTSPLYTWQKMQLTCPIPWTFTKGLFRGKSAARLAFDLIDAALPSCSAQLRNTVEALVQFVRLSPEAKNLDAAYRSISQLGLLPRLAKAHHQFELEYSKTRIHTMDDVERSTEAMMLAEKAYAGSKILTQYVTTFLQFEDLLTRVYWLLAQITMKEQISYLSSGEPQQLQQVLVFKPTTETYITAVAPTYALTLHPAELVHITLPELDHHYDGIYQVGRLQLKWLVESGARIYVKALLQWRCELQVLRANFGETIAGIFVKSEERPVLELIRGTRVVLRPGGDDEQEINLIEISHGLELNDSLVFP